MQPPSLVLFDLDGVLAAYSHARRMAHLGEALGRTPEHVMAAVFDSGLEPRYDEGVLSTDEYLAGIGDILGCTVDGDAWRASRLAGMSCTDASCTRVLELARHCEIAVLTNNGQMVVDLLPQAMPRLFPLLDGRVFCSAAMRRSKPSPDAFLHVLQRLGHAPGNTLFLDDNRVNVEAARATGLHAEHIETPGEFDAILVAYGL
jgi:putative hydrolase of the HAD superfamily